MADSMSKDAQTTKSPQPAASREDGKQRTGGGSGQSGRAPVVPQHTGVQKDPTLRSVTDRVVVGSGPVLSGKSVQQRADILQGTIPAGGKSDVRQNTVLASELARAFALTLPGSSGVNRVGVVQHVGNVEPVLVEPSGYNLRKRPANSDESGNNVRAKFA
jgi:hypothetical protein